ncbi:MAG: hypothetical protein OHK0036_17470 [Bacteroidia bacterium]
MLNTLITYSKYSNDGFANNLYILHDEPIDISEIDNYSQSAVLIPYNYKEIIEPSCFQNQTTHNYPIIIPVLIQKDFHDLDELESFIFFNKELQPNNDNVEFDFVSFEEYQENFLKIQEYLHKGDIYEMNYCIPFILKNIRLNPYQLFFELARKMQSPFTALMKIDKFFILSFSPERFLKKEGEYLYTEPIKGTAPRGKTKEEDEQLVKALKNSQKEKTENAMIVDVCRNDLSRIAQKGTVSVEELFTIKSYPTVHQMISKISCGVKSNVHFKDIIHATFPMASMTGAPKIRAMQIADELEKMPREFYSGCLGIYQNGDFDLSVLIRSIFYDTEKNEMKIWAGSAVTIYTDAQKEYDECLIKVKKILQTIKKLTFAKKV